MLSLPDYKITEKLYESSNSVIYRGLRNKDKRAVILKMPNQEFPGEITRFQHEYDILKTFNIKSIIHAHALDTQQDVPVIILEDLNAEPLKKFIHTRKFAVNEFLQLAIQICDGLNQIHESNIIHKDINPENIIINPETGQIKIIDFSISSLLPRQNLSLKTPWQLEGTLAYLSPEQTGRINRSVDYRSDLYSLGMTFYEWLSGRLPFDTEEAIEILHNHIAKKFRPLYELNKDTPLIISDIVMKLLEKNAEDRYQSASGIKADLEKCLNHFNKGDDLNNVQFKLAQGDNSGQFNIPQKLYGREHEIESLLKAFELVSRGNTELMLIVGYSGVGKTALVHEVHKPMTERKGYFSAGKFDQFNKTIPYYAITQAFNELCRYLLKEDATTLANWKKKINKALGNQAQVIIDIIPDLELIIGEQPDVAAVGLNETQNRFNRLFLKFVNALCQKDHPFVLFIDDLQWVDSASLNLLKNIMLDDEIKYLLILGAYRANEVDLSHPLIKSLEEILQSQAEIQTIEVSNLKLGDISHLLQDSLSSSAKNVLPLAKLIIAKTQGNAFFTHQFLKNLHEEKLLQFDFKKQIWNWDIKQISKLNLSDNVVELLTGKIDKLPAETSSILQLSACIGNRFDLNLLSLISEQDNCQTLKVLHPAIKEMLIQPLDENYKYQNSSENSRFIFMHDRIQQAAYEQLDQKQKQEANLKIGRLLLKSTPSDEIEEKIFDITEHFNQALELIKNKSELIKVSELNLIAGNKAKMATAFNTSMNYFRTGQQCLTKSDWKNHYELSLSLYSEATASAYLLGDIDLMNQLVQKVSENSRSPEDKIKTLEIKVFSLYARSQLADAIAIALEFLNSLGIDIPENPSEQDVGVAIQNIQQKLSERSIDSLIDLPIMTNATHQAAMRIMGAAIPAAFGCSPNLMILMIIKQIELSIEHGNHPDSLYIYSNYAIILCGILDDIETGYQYGLLNQKIVNHLEASNIKPRSQFLFNTFILFWKKHIKESLSPLLNNYQLGLETGDIEHGAFSLYFYFITAYFSGQPLDTLESEITDLGKAASKYNQGVLTLKINIYRQLCLNLMGESSKPYQIVGEAYDINKDLPIHQKAKDRNPIFQVYLNQGMLDFLFDRYVSALSNTKLARKFLDGATSMYISTVFYFYDSLIRLAVYPSLSAKKKTKALNKVNKNQQKMQLWADHAPMNFQHKYDLIAAEIARVLEKHSDAEKLYERAIDGAHTHKYINEEALAYELAANYYFAKSMDKAASQLITHSISCYQRWGAKAKVAQLRQKFSQLQHEFDPAEIKLSATYTTSSSSTSSLHASAQIDLNSVIKASQTLSGEIVLDKLLTKMMRIVIQTAGADRGLLLLPQQEKWFIEAEGRAQNETINVLQSISIDGKDLVPVSIIRYLNHTKENIVLANAYEQGEFTNDEYILNIKPKSVLALPLLKQKQLTGILYLENKLTEGAFTRQRLEILNILSSQMAVSIENSLLYKNLEEKVSERTIKLQDTIERLSKTQEHLIESEKMASLGRLVAGVAHELNTPIGICVTGTSFLQEKTTRLYDEFKKNNIRKNDFIEYIESNAEMTKVISNNLNKASDLISNFKQVSVDMSNELTRSFNLNDYLHTIQQSLLPEFRKTQHQVDIRCDPKLVINSHPGTLSQILTNLLMNSLNHAFEPTEQGLIIIDAIKKRDKIILTYCDDGAGMSEVVLKNIFEPFYTTRRNLGGTGLGMFIVYNLVTHTLDGEVNCTSQPGEGTIFTIIFPADDHE